MSNGTSYLIHFYGAAAVTYCQQFSDHFLSYEKLLSQELIISKMSSHSRHIDFKIINVSEDIKK